jgi:dihydroorotate dehydrogenase (NAD+) catalytic subunit
VGKSITRHERAGNPPPRMAETPAGMLNAIGLQNPGLENYLEHTLPRLLSYGAPVIVNVAGKTIEDYRELSRRFSEIPGPIALEINLSCPNVKEGGLSFSACPGAAESVCRSVAEVCKLPFFAKLTPNVADIASVARACEAGGAAGISAINTLIGMAVDWRKRRPLLANGTGGLSGPAIKPVALRMVQEIYRAVSIPIIGIGGIRTAEDVLEFMVCGATAVQVGTATFTNPYTIPRILEDLPRLLDEARIARASDLVGTLGENTRTTHA